MQWLIITLLFPVLTLAQTKPPPEYVKDLREAYTKTAANDIEAFDLLDRAMKKSGSGTAEEFLKKISFCDEGKGGGVQQQNNEKLLFIARELDESEFNSNDVNLKGHYLKGALSEFPPDLDSQKLVWIVEPDMITLHSPMTSEHQICISSIPPATEAVELLAHELVHYVNQAPAEAPDMVSYKDFDDYMQKQLYSPGEEFDAYLVQFKMLIRHHQLQGMSHYESAKRFFSDSGELKVAKSELGNYILTDLNYKNMRYRGEYFSALQIALKLETNKQHLLEQISTKRTAQIEEAKQILGNINHLIQTVSSEYRKNLESMQIRLTNALASKDRIEKAIQIQKQRVEKLQSMLNAAQGNAK